MPERDRPVVLVLVVLGLVDLVLEPEGRRLVVDDGGGRQVPAPFVGGRLEGGQVDEGLEDGAGLAPGGEDAVVLRQVVGPPADPGEDLAVARVDGEQRRLGGARAVLALREQRIHLRETLAHGILGEPLQVQVERRVDVEALRGLHDGGELLGQLLPDGVDEVRGLGLERAGDDHERFLRGRLRRVLADEAGLQHLLQHDVASVPGAGRSGKGRQVVGRVDDAGDRRRLGQRQVVDVLAEEQPRALGDAMDRERATLPEIDLVEVELQDFVLRGAALEHERHELLGDLPAHRLLEGVREDRRQEDVLDELLRDGAAALEVGPVPREVGDQRTGHPDRVDARVLVETPVFDGQDRVHHVPRDLLEGDLAPFSPLARHERGQQRRLRPHDVARPDADDLDSLDVVGGREARLRWRAGEDRPDGPAGKLPGPRNERDRRVGNRELGRLGGAVALRVAENG